MGEVAGETDGPLKDILERKWQSVSKLKKQVMELEKETKELRQNLDDALAG